ncbi:hypothetical protein Ga0074115_101114 [endosymbiont of Ridgeia piscesae]|uniref:Carboxypeptidase regulatory-like domain-containing protein n=3 Tax=endosymbiont of Ridgeia piscesae TaxID=54398 RepID=A0A0T5YSZ5_9GAMM|nr:carboxypeptidase-like regulatory domain-containing protein [endosymbiont of Ridgeia piscesae]KRT53779.1 hypothetical protein Ga0074115_101114 [endosymbiont of Ridgeia piscesae]
MFNLNTRTGLVEGVALLAAGAVVLLFVFSSTRTPPLEEDGLSSDQLNIPSRPETPAPVDGDARILRLVDDKGVLSDGLIGYLHQGELLLPLSGISYAMGYPIQVSSRAGRAEGWFGEPPQRFELDYSQGLVWVDGRRFRLERERIELHLDDIFVHPSQLQQWFSLHLSVDLDAAQVRLVSDQLPVRRHREALLEGPVSRPTEVDDGKRPLSVSYPLGDGGSDAPLAGEADNLPPGRSLPAPVLPSAAPSPAAVEANVPIDSPKPGPAGRQFAYLPDVFADHQFTHRRDVSRITDQPGRRREPDLPAKQGPSAGVGDGHPARRADVGAAGSAQKVSGEPALTRGHPPQELNSAAMVVPDAEVSLEPTSRPAEDELILQLVVGRTVLSDGLLGYLVPSGVLLPLSDFFYAVEFPIQVTAAEGHASGWFIDERHQFDLDYARGEVRVDGRVHKLNRNLVELHQHEIYVHSSLLQQWLPLRLSVDLASLRLKLEPDEALPFQQRAQRQMRRQMLGRKWEAGDELQLPYLPDVFEAVEVPLIDLSGSLAHRGVKGQPASNAAQFNMLATGDLLWMNGKLYVSGNESDAISNVRLTLSRKDPEGRVFGEHLGVTSVALGDVYSPSMALVSGSGSGRGLTLSSMPLNHPTEFSKTHLTGELLQGWEVELYRNGELLDSQISRSDGRYEFLDVPLLPGNNHMKLVFYGPQGQRREEVRRVLVGAGQVSPGEQQFQVGINQKDEGVVELDERKDSGDSARGAYQLALEYERGISNNLTLGSSFTALPMADGERRYYLGVNARGSLLGAFSRVDLVHDLMAGGVALGLDLQTQQDLFSLTLSHDQFFNFTSRKTGVMEGDDPLLSNTDFRLDGDIDAFNLRYALTFGWDRFRSGNSEIHVGNRLSLFWADTAFTNTLDYYYSGQQTGHSSGLNGALRASGRYNDFRLRGTLDYALLMPGVSLDQLSGTLDWRVGDGYSLRADLSYNFGTSVISLGGSLNRKFKYFALSLSSSYSSDEKLNVGLTWSLSLGREPRHGSWFIWPEKRASYGAVSASVFIDRNMNGVFDQGETPLVGTRFRRGSVPDDALSAEYGVLLLTGLAPHRPTQVMPILGSVEDPSLMPVYKGVVLFPRPGHATRVDFPFTPTGEIDGSVLLIDGGSTKELSNVDIELLNREGKVVAVERTAYDGFYLFSGVFPGDYRVRVSPEQARQLSFEASREVKLTIAPDGDVISGIDFKLRLTASH